MSITVSKKSRGRALRNLVSASVRATLVPEPGRALLLGRLPCSLILAPIGRSWPSCTPPARLRLTRPGRTAPGARARTGTIRTCSWWPIRSERRQAGSERLRCGKLYVAAARAIPSRAWLIQNVQPVLRAEQIYPGMLVNSFAGVLWLQDAEMGRRLRAEQCADRR